MKYSTDLIKDISIENILSKVTEYDIFRYYMQKDFKLNHIISSPLRIDNNPSFGIFKSNNGKLLFKDQATGDTGDCFDFVKLKENISFNKALKLIWNNLIKNNLVKSEFGKNIEKLNISKDSEILVKKRNFCNIDDDYWGQYYITRDDLKKFNIFPIDYFYYNGELKPYKYSKEEPMYAYFIFNKIKIYRPLSDKKCKWRGNAGTYDIQGYEQLPDKCEHIIITKSLKDVIVLTNLGYNAIAPNGENHDIPKKIIDKLIKDKGVKEFTIFYDNDESGIKASYKLLEKYTICENPICIAQVRLPNGDKDISDYIRYHPIEEVKQWCKDNLDIPISC